MFISMYYYTNCSYFQDECERFRICHDLFLEQIKLVDTGHVSKWKDAFVFCKDQTLWKQLLNDCQPETCNASAVADKIINKSNLGREQYWIYGYVLRSPVIVNKGIYFKLFVVLY